MRLGEANAMHPYFFLDYVTGRSTKRKTAPHIADMVITLCGQAGNSLRYAILELCTPQDSPS